jgi:hypothetical protein
MPKHFNDDDLREAMLKTHRESYELWWRLVGSTRDKEQVKSLYRYREGFDHALINLARKLGVDLARSDQQKTNKGSEPRPETDAPDQARLPVCTQCGEPLFKVGKKVWNCPGCKMDYLLGEE